MSIRNTFALLSVVFILGCDSSESTRPQSEKSLFESERAAEEKTIGAQTTLAAQSVLSGAWVNAKDPIRAGVLLNAIVREKGRPSDRTKSEVQKFLLKFDESAAFLKSYEAGLDHLESMGAAWAASKIFAALDNSENTSTRSLKSKFTTKWNAFTQSARSPNSWNKAFVPYSPPGADCGEAPPANGSLPSSTTGKAGLDLALEAESHLIENAESLRFKNASASDLEKFRVIAVKLHRHVTRKLSQSDSSTQAYLDSVKALLGNMGQADPDALAKSAQSVLAQQNELTSRYNSRLRDLALVPSAPFNDKLVDFDGAEGEGPFHFIDNKPTELDGRHYPWFTSNPIDPPKADPVVLGVSDVYTVIIDGSEKQAVFPMDFTMTKFSRKIDHIDYRLRKENDLNVIKSRRHVPNEANQIAIGHAFNFHGLKNTAGVEYFVVQAVPMDAANHPSTGACNYIKVKYRTQAEVDAEKEAANKSASGFLATILMEALDPIHYDHECEPWGLGGFTSFDFPARTAWIEPSAASAGFDITPDSSVYIVKSGEIVEIVNKDTVAHRFISTDTSYFSTVTKSSGSPVSTGGFTFEVINSDKVPQGLINDTGLIEPGKSKLIRLQTGLPGPYYFNLREMGPVGDLSTTPQIHLYYYNVECL